MLQHLESRKKTDFAIELESFLVTGTGSFSKRYKRQIKPIHVAAGPCRPSETVLAFYIPSHKVVGEISFPSILLSGQFSRLRTCILNPKSHPHGVPQFATF